MLDEKYTVTIRVEFAALLKKTVKDRKFDMEVPRGTDVGELLKLLGYGERERRFISAVVDGELVRSDAELRGGENVFLTIPVGGG